MRRLSGLWAGLTGGVVLLALMVYLDPVTDQRDCPNYGGAGNASAFHDERWELYLPLLCLAWMAAVVVEQFLPPARRARAAGSAAGLRALAACLLTVVASCCGVAPLLVACH